MKKLLHIFMLLIAVSSFLSLQRAFAETKSFTRGDIIFTLILNKTSATADGKDLITGKLHATETYKPNPPSCAVTAVPRTSNEAIGEGAYYQFLVRGQNIVFNTTGDWKVEATQSGAEEKSVVSKIGITVQPTSSIYVYPTKSTCWDPVDINFSIASSVAQESLFTVVHPMEMSSGKSTSTDYIPWDYPENNFTINFVAPVPSPTTKKSTTSTAALTPAKPTLSLTTTARISNTNVSSTLDTTKPISIFPTQKLTFSGATSANAKVALTIKSEPITKEVTADKDGKWTFTLDPKALKLAYGAHTVSAIATNTDGIKSDTVEIAKFELKKPIVAAKIEPYKFKAKDLLTPMNYILFGLIILLGGFLTFLILKRKKLRHLNPNPKLDVHI